MKLNVNSVVNNIYKDGYYIAKNVLNERTCNRMSKSLKNLKKKISNNKYYKDELSESGQIVIRDLVLRDPTKFLFLIDNKLIMNVLKKIFKDTFILDNCMASNSILINKKKYKSLVHIDSHLPCKENQNTSDVVVMYCFDNFNKDNGTTKIWPKSHLSGIHIHKNGNKKFLKNKKYTLLNAKKGSVGFILGQTWHQIGENITTDSRWSIIIHYKRWWIKPSTDFTKCGTAIFNKLNPMQKKLLGFTSISPKFNLKKLKRNHKTLRKIEKVPNEYKKSLNY